MSDSTNAKPRPNLSEAWQESLTQRVIRDLEEGVPTWVKPWRNGKGGGTVGMPRNAFTGRPYSGANVLQLWALARENGYKTHQWCTYDQANTAGARVRKGQKSTQVIYVNFQERKDKETDEKARRVPFLKVFWVFNLDQLENVPAVHLAPQEPLPDDIRYEEALQFFSNTGIQTLFAGNRAAYSPRNDIIQMPEYAQFESDEAFFGTWGHEHLHATGTKERCNRVFGKKFGDEAYAAEELVAELGSAFLCASLGIPPSTRSTAAYIASWLKVLKDDHKAIVSAASYASQAYTWLTNKVAENQPQEATDEQRQNLERVAVIAETAARTGHSYRDTSRPTF